MLLYITTNYRKGQQKMKKVWSITLLLLMLLLTACGASADAPALVTIAPSHPASTSTPGPTPTPTPTPEPTPTPTPDPAQEILADMTLAEKICQLMVVRPEALMGVSPVTVAGETTREALEQWPVGGFIYSAQNLVDGEQTMSMIANAQSYSKLGLIISADEEGGRVARLMRTLGTTQIGPMYDYKDMGTETAYENAFTIGSDMAAYGFNTDYAPVADVWTNPENTVIGDRAYSDDFDQAAELVPSAVQGFHDAGVINCLKHFPGHGDTDTDTHSGAAVVDKSVDELMEGELKPFIAGMEAGADMVMVGHITMTAIDPDHPASLSEAVVTGLLREQLGWDGVVITDGLEMGALTQYDMGERCLMALEAGVDLLLGVDDIPGAVKAIAEAVEMGRLTEQRIDESVLRVLDLKLEHGIIG